MIQKTGRERRTYIRLKSVFPVELFLSGSQDPANKRMIQGFTCDVSRGGFCMRINDPCPEILSAVSDDKRSFTIHINMPVTHRPIEVEALAAWHRIKEKKHFKRLKIGFQYTNIAEADRKRIMSAARQSIWLPRTAVLLILVLVGLLGFNQYHTVLVTKKNRELIGNFQNIQRKIDAYTQSARKLDKEYDFYEKELGEISRQQVTLDTKLGDIDPAGMKTLIAEKIELEKELDLVKSEKSSLENRLNDITQRRSRTETLLRAADMDRQLLEKDTLENMFQWIRTHQNKFTGLIMSFEGDPAIKNWGFTYDQALACQVFLLSGDDDRAARILFFYKNKAKMSKSGYLNAYNVMTGKPVENIVHMGPNIWIAIAAIQYTDKTGDNKYLSVAEDVARWVILNRDNEGGITGGPGITWYSTEHNLDAYALFSMLYDVTKDKKYEKEATSTLKWIKDNTYSPETGRMKRGKGDSTIATDTMAWAIAAIGPAMLFKEKMDPDAMLDFAENNCLVETDFIRPDGSKIKIKGFDFSRSANIARGGVVSSEWSAQMIMAFRIMARFYTDLGEKEKAEKYSSKASLYLRELDKMVISSPSRSGQGAGCLPYATQPNARTGHGWRTPDGRDTGSVAGTAYTIFAKENYNPLSLDE